MDTITKIPGLQHISEDIFKLLDTKSLMNCRLTNSSWKNVPDKLIFWLKKLKMEGWKALAKNFENQQFAKEFARDVLESVYLQPDIQSKWRVLLHELENNHQQKEFVLILIKFCNERRGLLPLDVVVIFKGTNKYLDLVESILENENPRSHVSYFYPIKNWHSLKNVTSIHLAALYGLTRVVVKLSKKYDDPMVKDTDGKTAIHLAAFNGHLNIVKHLMEFTDTPMAPDIFGLTPIHYAAVNGNLDTVKFLVGLINIPDDLRMTLIKGAEIHQNVEVRKFLENYSK